MTTEYNQKSLNSFCRRGLASLIGGSLLVNCEFEEEKIVTVCVIIIAILKIPGDWLNAKSFKHKQLKSSWTSCTLKKNTDTDTEHKINAKDVLSHC